MENVHFYKQGEGHWKSIDKWTTKISCSTGKYVGGKQTLELALSSSYLLFLCFFGTLLLFFFVHMVGWSSAGWKVDISASRSFILRVILLRNQFEFTQL